ncbi:MAG TPA: hypothetical protein VKU60_19710, partial [Chloroflexota bacterium]|nr:hypothetical protein [Chloroflexota bacterium]
VWNLVLDVYRPIEGAPRLPLDASADTTLPLSRFLVLPLQASPSSSPEATFGGSLALMSHSQQAGPDNLQVTLQWQVTSPLDRDYTVFLHLLDSAGTLVRQSDSQPAEGRFPTSLLTSASRIEDRHTLATVGLPAGDYQLETGVYDAQTGERLRLSDSDQDAVSWPVQLPYPPLSS